MEEKANLLMDLLRKNILIISPEKWGTNHISKHHYAQELASRGNYVFFLNPPGIERFKISVIRKGLIVVDYKPLFQGLRHLQRWLSSFLTFIEIRNIERRLSSTINVIWNFDSSRFFNLGVLDSKCRICHIVDMSENIRRDLLAQTSDVCFCTSDFISKELLKYNSNVFKIHHGYHETTPANIDENLGKEGFLKVGYIGNLAIKYIDWNLIFGLTTKFPKVEFHLIGSYKVSNLSSTNLDNTIIEKLNKHGNVFLHGQKESSLIPTYLKQFDVLINVYHVNDLSRKQLSNPHKIMEYLGSGKTIISTYMDEYKDKRHLLEMVDTKEEFISKFAEVVENIDEYNSPEKQKERIGFAMDNTYTKQLDRIEEILKKL